MGWWCRLQNRLVHNVPGPFLLLFCFLILWADDNLVGVQLTYMCWCWWFELLNCTTLAKVMQWCQGIRLTAVCVKHVYVAATGSVDSLGGTKPELMHALASWRHWSIWISWVASTPAALGKKLNGPTRLVSDDPKINVLSYLQCLAVFGVLLGWTNTACP